MRRGGAGATSGFDQPFVVTGRGGAGRAPPTKRCIPAIVRRMTEGGLLVEVGIKRQTSRRERRLA